MSNSPLVNYKYISPNRTSPRNHTIDTITIHCYVGQVSVESMAAWLCNPDAGASANYGIGSDGRIALFVEEKDRSWCSSNRDNDNRAITIECASDARDPYAINDKVYNSLIKLCADICKRNSIKQLKWKADKSLIGHVDKQNMTVHRWFANKACPGDYIYNRLGQIADEVNMKLGSYQNGVQASSFVHMAEIDVINKVGPLFTKSQKTTGILASVCVAQFILESAYGTSELAVNANNCFGMKRILSGNNWDGSVWDGHSTYAKKTKEWDGRKYVEITALFRKYPSVEKSITDHAAYLSNAMNGDKKRYAGLVGCKEPKKAIHIIKSGGYATDPAYEDSLLKIIEMWNLTRFDLTEDKPAKVNTPSEINPVTVHVSIPNLNIRTGPGIGYAVTGNVTGVGTFTIVEIKEGKGSNTGWGRLKSGAGWISMDYTKRV